MTTSYFENGQQMTWHVGMGKGHHLPLPHQGPDWHVKLLPQLKVIEDTGHLTHNPGLNTVRTAGQIRNSGMLTILRRNFPMSPCPRHSFHQNVRALLCWKQRSQRNILMVKRSPGEGLDCKTHPTLSSVAITATALGLHFQDLWKSLS